jgi:uncharacterized protein (TIGR04255 family)
MSGHPSFTSPPVVELVLGVQFDRLPLSAGHYGLFWSELGNGWVKPSDGPPLDEQFEQFEQPRWVLPPGIQLRLAPADGPGRLLLGHQDESRLIQVQPNRFHLNWRRRDGVYPSYGKLVGEFEDLFARFSRFTHARGLGDVRPNQWELTYIDAFPRGELWNSPSDWSSLLPGLFGRLLPGEELGLVLEHRAAEWAFEIQPRKGRLHVAANYGSWGPGKEASLLLHMTARGPITDGWRTGLDIGHEAAVGAFVRVLSDEAKTRFGIQS